MGFTRHKQTDRHRQGQQDRNKREQDDDDDDKGKQGTRHAKTGRHKKHNDDTAGPQAQAGNNTQDHREAHMRQKTQNEHLLMD